MPYDQTTLDPTDPGFLAGLIQGLLLGDLDADDLAGSDEDVGVADVTTFEEAGLLTSNDGVVVTLDDGTEFQVTIVHSR